MRQRAQIFIAEPASDETLHSVLIRTQRAHAYSDFRSFTSLIFDRPTDGRGWPWSLRRILPYLDSNRRTAEVRLHKMLTLAYFVPFTPAQYLNQAALDPHGTARSNPAIHGIFRAMHFGRTPLRYCPQCVVTSLRRSQQSHWLRSHQLPSVNACWLHGVELKEVVQIFKRPRLPHEYSDQEIRFRASKDDLWFARSSSNLLHGSFQCLNAEARFRAYRFQAHSLGYGPPLQIDLEVMASHVQRKFSATFLQRVLGSSDRRELANAISRATCGSDRPTSPALHLICVELLFGGLSQFFARVTAIERDMDRYAMTLPSRRQMYGERTSRRIQSVHESIFMDHVRIHGHDTLSFLEKAYPRTYEWLEKHASQWAFRRTVNVTGMKKRRNRDARGIVETQPIVSAASCSSADSDEGVGSENRLGVSDEVEKSHAILSGIARTLLQGRA